MASEPTSPFDKVGADRLADEVDVLIRRKVIDFRSPAADALLDYREPPRSPRSDRLVTLETELAALRARCEAAERERDEANRRACRLYAASMTAPATEGVPPYFVLRHRETEPWEVWPFNDRLDAVAQYDEARWNWTETYILAPLAALLSAEAAVATLTAERERLKVLLDHDHTGLAAALNAIRSEVAGRDWLRAKGDGDVGGSWSAYSYEEHTQATLRKEIGWALDAIQRIAGVALSESGIRADAAFHPERDKLAAAESASASLREALCVLADSTAALLGASEARGTDDDGHREEKGKLHAALAAAVVALLAHPAPAAPRTEAVDLALTTDAAAASEAPRG